MIADAVDAIVVEVVGPKADTRESLPESDRDEYDRLRRRHGFSESAAMHILRGRAQER